MIQVCFAQLCQADDGYNFKRFSTEDGLSQISVLDIQEDSHGFIWIGTRNGLNVYNGFKFEHFFTDPWDSTSLINNHINAILPDKFNNLWIGTNGGLCRFDREQGTFKRYNNDHITEGKWLINSLLIDSFNNLWIMSNLGVHQLPFESDVVKSVIKKNQASQKKLSMFNCAILDEIGNIWFGGQDGIYYYEKNDESLTLSQKYEEHSKTGITNVRAMKLITNNDLWIGTETHNWHINLATDKVNSKLSIYSTEDGNQKLEIRKIIEGPNNKLMVSSYSGIYIYDPEERKFTDRIFHDSAKPLSLSDNSVHSMLVTKNEDLWLGTYSGGLNYYSPTQNIFVVHRQNNTLNESLNSNIINGFVEGADGKLYIATSRGGLNIYNPETGKYSYLIENINTRHLAIDNQNMLWISSFFSGMFRYDLNTNKMYSYLERDNANGNFIDKYGTRHSTLIDKEGNVWVAAWNSIYKYRRETDDFEKYTYQYEGDNYHWISQLLQVGDDIWLMTNSGIRVFSTITNEYVNHYQFSFSDSTSLPNNFASSAVIDLNGNVWVGSQAGISKFSRKEENFTTLSTDHGLPSNMVECMLVDENNNIWVSTSNGLVVLDQSTMNFRIFDKSNNLQSSAFRTGACYACDDGKMLFGGVNGFNEINPKEIVSESEELKVVLTDFSLFNEKLKPKVHSTLTKNLNFMDTIQLSFEDNVISIGYTAIDYSDAEKNNYSYILDGFENNWNHVENNRTATYTNLEPGSYVFRVRASNEKGLMSEIETKLVLKIEPPFWMTKWFRIIAVLVIVIIVLLVHQNRVKLLIQQKNNLDQKVLIRTQVIEDQKKDLVEKNESLQKAEEEVRTANEQLKVVNDNLELIVEARTQKIKIKNEKIKEVAFLNSHKVRAPLVRILGLINLFKTGNVTPSEMKSMNEKIHESALELDQITRKVNTELNDELDDNS
ncbi:MAG: hypothetical protein JXR07_18495 [Reichenbachiella sp.]